MIRSKLIGGAALIFITVVFISAAMPWGFWAHKRINKMAVFTLPEGMFGFYKHHIDFLTQNAVTPDKRRYSNPDEAPRHYIDLDHYGTFPFDSIPRKWREAAAKFSEDTLLRYGVLPWHVHQMTHWLTQAFITRDAEKILRLSSDIGHYIADAHVPLHTTKNYNGQLTNQHGIHAFWESRVPELFGEDFDYFIGKAEYIDDPLAFIWNIVLESHLRVDSVLQFEKSLRERFPEDRIFTFEQKGNTAVRAYSNEFSKEYNKLLNNMAERKMRESIVAIGSIWLTAWVNAGQPKLLDLLNEDLKENLKRELEAVETDSIKIINSRDHQDHGVE